MVRSLSTSKLPAVPAQALLAEQHRPREVALMAMAAVTSTGDTRTSPMVLRTTSNTRLAPARHPKRRAGSR